MRPDMLTFFTTPKPFAGHIGVIQHNAIRSWQCLHPEVEVILFGNEEGAEASCRELGIRHIPDVRRNPYGTKYLAGIFDRAQELATHDILCYLNCDMLLMSDFQRAVLSVSNLKKDSLLAGRRWDVDIQIPLDFQRAGWEEAVRYLALQTNRQRPAQWIDYFVFSKGLYYQKIPEFVIGRPGWDNWLIWFALFSGVPVVDLSKDVCAVHQNHDYSYHPEGEQGVWQGEEAQENYRLLENGRKFRTLESAVYVLESGQLRRNPARWLVLPRRYLHDWLYAVWFSLLKLTRPIRHRVGLKQDTLAPLFWRRGRAPRSRS
jgi:hypothetical protein